MKSEQPLYSKKYADRLRKLRESKSLWICDLAEISGIDPSDIGNMERRRRVIGLARAVRLGEALGVPYRELCDPSRVR